MWDSRLATSSLSSARVSGRSPLFFILRYSLVMPSLVLASATIAMISPVVPSIFRAASLSGPSLRPEM